MRALTIGIASWQNPNALDAAIHSVRRHSATDWTLLVIDNASPNPAVREVINRHSAEEPRVRAIMLDMNTGYVGAVNSLLSCAMTEYVAYLDNDVVIQTDAWDETLASYLDRFHEIGIIFPHGGAYPIPRGAYHEILWGVGSCWMVSRVAAEDARWINPVFDPGGLAVTDDAPFFDPTLGHHEEVDFQTRLRLAGYRIASARDVSVAHAGTASADPASQDRITRGVIRWVNKWCRYFYGSRVTYHSSNVLRHEDWPPSRLYLEEYWKLHLPGLNDAPETITHGGEYDLIRVPRLRGFYRGRIV